MLKTVVAMFLDSADARRAVYDLEQAGFPLTEVSVAMRQHYDSAFLSQGSLLGAGVVPNQATTTPMDHGQTRVAGLAPATGETAPGFGPLVAAGRLAECLGGAALGMAAGGLSGALSDVGIPNELATQLVDRVRSGRETLVSIRVEMAETAKVEKLFVDNQANVVYRSADKASAYYESTRSSQAAQFGF